MSVDAEVVVDGPAVHVVVDGSVVDLVVDGPAVEVVVLDGSEAVIMLVMDGSEEESEANPVMEHLSGTLLLWLFLCKHYQVIYVNVGCCHTLAVKKIPAFSCDNSNVVGAKVARNYLASSPLLPPHVQHPHSIKTI